MSAISSMLSRQLENFILLAAKENSKLGLLSAGSGITPVMAIARWMLEQSADADIHFIHSAHSERDIIFREELQKMAQRHANFRLDFFLSKPEGTIACHTGRLTAEGLSEVLQDAASRQLFLCAPGPTWKWSLAGISHKVCLLNAFIRKVLRCRSFRQGRVVGRCFICLHLLSARRLRLPTARLCSK